MKIINDLPSMKGCFLKPESRLPQDWEILKDQKDIVLILNEPTSCALAFKVWPEAKQNISLIVYVGGTLSQGDASAYAEKSIYNDPYAMESLMNSGIHILFVKLEDAKKLNKDINDLALDIANNKEKYQLIECGVHIEIQEDSPAFGKVVCDYLADKKFEKKNAYILNTINI